MYLTRYARFQEAKTGVFDYARFYNHRRCHPTLGYLSLPPRQDSCRVS